MKQLLKDMVLICIGLFIMGLGSALVYQAALGTGSIGTMVDGVHHTLGISRGRADILISMCLLVIVAVFARDLINAGTVVSMLVTGLSVDFWKGILGLAVVESPVGIYGMYFLGMIFGAMGTGFYVAVNAGISAYDATIMAVYRHSRWQYRYAKILTDFLLMLVGICLGGTIGVGTIVSTIAGGYLTQFFIKRSTKLLGKKAILDNE